MKKKVDTSKKPYVTICCKCGTRFYTNNRRFKLCRGCRNENLPISEGRRGYIRLSKNRAIAFKRDSYRCQCCGDNVKLTIHHIDTDFRNNDLSNLITLCEQCHHSIHKRFSNKELKENNIYNLFPYKIRWGAFGKRLIYNKEQEEYRKLNKQIRPKKFKKK